MRVNRYNFLFVIGLVVTLGLTTVFANTDDNKSKRPKNTGTLSVKTTGKSLPVRVDGLEVGPSGVGKGAEFYLEPGFHTVEVLGPNGKVWKEEVEIRRDAKHCICLKLVSDPIVTACPYRFYLEGPESITEGDLVTFSAINSGTAPVPLRYAWKVSSGRITSGIGTPSITVDSAGMGRGTINAELDVNDNVYDNKCRQIISVPTKVTPPDEVITPKPYRCDEWPTKAADDDKARFDNCVIQVQNTPDAQLYVIIYPGTDRASLTRFTYERVSKRALDYFVKTRGLDPRRISMVKGSTRATTTYDVWIVPPGAQPPVVQ